MSQPAIVISRTGSVLGMNVQAANLDGREFQISRGRLMLGDSGAAASYANMLGHIKSKSLLCVLGAPLIICRRERHPVLMLRVLPIDPSISEPFLGAAALLLLTDLTTLLPAPKLNVVSSALGLTLAEARVAVALSEGHSTTTIADQLSISVETVRTHLKRIYGKLGVERQSHLTAIIAKLSAAGG
jgi:DNA-binding CsgD family transcriptional regulator